MDPHQIKLIEAAKQLGIEVKPLQASWQIDAVELCYQGRKEIVTLGRVFSHLSAVADQIAANKIASKTLMQSLGIPVSPDILVDALHLDIDRIRGFLKRQPLAVVKPLVGTDGEGIAMHLDSAEAVRTHIEAFPNLGKHWILEAQIHGEDLRLQYLNGELVAACVRKPCYIIGDGQQNIKSLIDARNTLIQAQNPDNFIVIDHQVKRRLIAAGICLDTVLEAGRELQIKDVSNMAQGGHAIDVTPDVHPRYLEYLNRLSESLSMRILSLDVMTTSPAADPAEHACVLEFNAQPAWLHHTFSEGKRHDIPTMLLKDLFQIEA